MVHNITSVRTQLFFPASSKKYGNIEFEGGVYLCFIYFAMLKTKGLCRVEENQCTSMCKELERIEG